MTGDADGPTQPTVSDLVDRLDEDVVRRLLGDAAARDEETGRAVRLAAAGPSERLGVLAAEVDSGLRTLSIERRWLRSRPGLIGLRPGMRWSGWRSWIGTWTRSWRCWVGICRRRTSTSGWPKPWSSSTCPMRRFAGPETGSIGRLVGR